MAEDIKKAYNDLQKQHRLPSFEDIDHDFEISLIEHTQFLLREINQKIFDKVDFFTKLIEAALHPDTNSIAEMNEYRFLDDKEKDDLFEFYKDLARIHRTLISLSIKNDNSLIAGSIIEIYKKWPDIKERMFVLTKKLSESWTESTDATLNLDYMG